jgi:hypothetical protein
MLIGMDAGNEEENLKGAQGWKGENLMRVVCGALRLKLMR